MIRLRSRRIRSSRAAAVGIGLLLIFSALALSPAGWPWGQRAAEKVAMGASSPLLKAVAAVHGLSMSLWDPFMKADQIREENAQLRREVARLSVGKVEAERQLNQATGRLAVNEWPMDLELRYLAAPVYAIGPSPRSRSMIIGRGSDDGIEENMAVLSPPGVAGVVRHVMDRQSLVQLVVDRRIEWGGTVGEEDAISGILQGTGEWERLLFVFETDVGDPQEGDRVYTSGVSGSLFPSRLPIGEVENVRFDKNGRRVADVRPLALLTTPDEVYVILGTPPDVDPSLEKLAR